MDWVDHDVALKRVYGAWCGYCEVFPEERGAGSLRVVRHLLGNSYCVVGNLQIQYVVRRECGWASDVGQNLEGGERRVLAAIHGLDTFWIPPTAVLSRPIPA